MAGGGSKKTGQEVKKKEKKLDSARGNAKRGRALRLTDKTAGLGRRCMWGGGKHLVNVSENL